MLLVIDHQPGPNAEKAGAQNAKQGHRALLDPEQAEMVNRHGRDQLGGEQERKERPRADFRRRPGRGGHKDRAQRPADDEQVRRRIGDALKAGPAGAIRQHRHRRQHDQRPGGEADQRRAQRRTQMP